MDPLTPLAERLRPQTLDEFIGQEHLIGPGAVLRKSLEAKRIPSLIFWGPPGVGKTTLAQVIAKELDRPFYALSAVQSGVKDVRNVLEKVEKSGLFGSQNALLFIDEIHRFNKSQQDALLNAVEKGIITLLGATTENPSFEVIPALLSRCQVYVLKSFQQKELLELVKRAQENDKWLREKKITLKEENALFLQSGGDARKLLNIIELLSSVPEKKIEITDQSVMDAIQQNMARYDKSGEQHYDIISAFIKSIRGSDPNAAVYWLARMTEGGEDPKFIARRMLIAAAEDIGNANPTALVMANNCFQAVNVIGWPECRIILSQCAIYLATSAKSNAAYQAINKAQETVRKTGDLSVPLHIRNAPTALMKELNYGKDYNYSHNNENNFAEQEYLPEEIEGSVFFEPGNNSKEQNMRAFLRERWKKKYNY